jgi:hypothetical protein
MTLATLQLHAAEMNTVPVRPDVDAFLAQLTSTNLNDSARASLALVKIGKSILPRLIEEMNKPAYLSQEITLKKLGDPKWVQRMRIANVIEDMTGKNFLVRTSAHGWNPDCSFDAINGWWEKRKSETNDVLKTDVVSPAQVQQ